MAEVHEPAIRVEDLRFSYGDVEAVKGISFEVMPGEILGFLGPNGAGKSTTIKMLIGLLPPQGGRATVLGTDVALDDPGLQARIGVCFEEKNLYLNMTARENLEFFAALFGVKDADVDGRFAAWGSQTGPTTASRRSRRACGSA